MLEDTILDEIYPGGFWSLMRNRDMRQRPYSNVVDVLPARDADFSVLQEATVESPTANADDFDKHDFRGKAASMQVEFAGKSKLLFVHALVIASLRRREAPARAEVLFQRIWAERGVELVQQLNVRWQISAATTFADHGLNMTQRSLGMGLSVMFDMIKIHETERRLSGQPGRRPFRRKRGRDIDLMPFDMEPYSLRMGDLDENMLSRLWALSEEDAVIAPLARAMLQLTIADRRTIFARMQRIKKRKKAK